MKCFVKSQILYQFLFKRSGNEEKAIFKNQLLCLKVFKTSDFVENFHLRKHSLTRIDPQRRQNFPFLGFFKKHDFEAKVFNRNHNLKLNFLKKRTDFESDFFARNQILK